MADGLTLTQAAEIWDGITRDLIALNPTIHFAAARTPDELEQVYRARYAEVIRRGWAEPDALSDGLERDDYDDRAHHMVGWEGGQLVITGRLVFPSADRLLPTENAYDLIIDPPRQVVDTGRAILVRADQSDPQHKLFLGLMGFAWQEMRARGYSHVCASMTASMLRLYRLMGIHWDVLGDARPYWGELRYPCKYNLVKTVETYIRRTQGDSSMRPKDIR